MEKNDFFDIKLSPRETHRYKTTYQDHQLLVKRCVGYMIILKTMFEPYCDIDHYLPMLLQKTIDFAESVVIRTKAKDLPYSDCLEYALKIVAEAFLSEHPTGEMKNMLKNNI